jgi:hypothetical protein
MKITYEHGDSIIIVYSTFLPTGECVVYLREGTYIKLRSSEPFKPYEVYFKPYEMTKYEYNYYSYRYGFLDLKEKEEVRLNKTTDIIERNREPRLLHMFEKIADYKIFPIDNKAGADDYAKKVLEKYKYDNVVKNMNKDELFDYVFKGDHRLNEPLMNAVKKRKAELDHEN